MRQEKLLIIDIKVETGQSTFNPEKNYNTFFRKITKSCFMDGGSLDSNALKNTRGRRPHRDDSTDIDHKYTLCF